jgi:hypothetical protein
MTNCSVLHILGMAFGDRAFKNNLTTLEAVYSLIVPPETEYLKLPWKTKWANRYVWRDIETTSDGLIRISDDKPLNYDKHRRMFISLGRTFGIRKQLQFYDIRRGAGKKLNEAVTPAERRRVMGHRSNIYEKYYMPTFVGVDCQAIYSGATQRRELMAAVGRMQRYRGAPTCLTEQQKLEIDQEPAIIAARNRNCSYKTMRRIRRAAELEKNIFNFFENVYSEEIERQLHGILPVALPPLKMEYELKERAAIARLITGPRGNTIQETTKLRCQFVKNLTQLCTKQETPLKYRSTASQQCEADNQLVVATVSTSLSTQKPSKVSKLCCPFCRHDQQTSSERKDFRYSRQSSLRRHIESHLLCPSSCPYERCSAVLGGKDHFFSHAARQHHLHL